MAFRCVRSDLGNRVYLRPRSSRADEDAENSTTTGHTGGRLGDDSQERQRLHLRVLDLSGTKNPGVGEWFEAEKAHEVLRGVMFLPGLGNNDGCKAVTPVGAWKTPPQPSQGLILLVRGHGVAREVAERAADQLGVGPPRLNLRGDWSGPDGVPTEAWAMALRQAANHFKRRA